MSSPSTLRPEITVTLRAGAVVVFDLPWQDALEFLKKLSGYANQLLAAGNGGTVSIDTLLPRLVELIGNADELSTFLILKSTGKDEAWLKGTLKDGGGREGGLSTLEFLTVLDAALQVNLSDELLALGKKVAGRLARVMPAKVQTSASPSPATS